MDFGKQIGSNLNAPTAVSFYATSQDKESPRVDGSLSSTAIAGEATREARR